MVQADGFRVGLSTLHAQWKFDESRRRPRFFIEATGSDAAALKEHARLFMAVPNTLPVGPMACLNDRLQRFTTQVDSPRYPRNGAPPAAYRRSVRL